MEKGRSFILLALIILALLSPLPATAGWFGMESEWEKSGLDLTTGYDQNTVTSITGHLTRIDIEGAAGPALAILQHDGENVQLVLGPKNYWRSKGIPLKPGDEIVARGSIALGRDGKTYLIVQQLSNSTTGGDSRLRADSGKPAWGGGAPERQRPMQMRQLRNGRVGR